MRYAAYLKTWTGIRTGYPPNGGGGGLGHATNITLADFVLHDALGVFAITQCTNYLLLVGPDDNNNNNTNNNNNSNSCDTSRFGIHNLTLRHWTGTARSDVVAELQCSAAQPCTGLAMEEGGIALWNPVNGTVPAQVLCDSVVAPVGFACTGPPWGENHR